MPHLRRTQSDPFHWNFVAIAASVDTVGRIRAVRVAVEHQHTKGITIGQTTHRQLQVMVQEMHTGSCGEIRKSFARDQNATVVVPELVLHETLIDAFLFHNENASGCSSRRDSK